MVLFGDRLRALRTERGITQQELGEAVHVSARVIGFYEANNRFPREEVVLKAIADYFDVSVDYILGRTSDRRGLPNKIENRNTVAIPILGVIRAGLPVLASENIEGYEPVTPEEAAGGEFFYLRVSGDSMNNARICEGDLVFVRCQPDVDNRDIAVVLIDGENATLKRVIKTDDGIILQPESSNPAHSPIYFPQGKGDFRIIGKVMHWKVFAKHS